MKGLKIACQEAFFACANRAVKDVDHSKLLALFEEFWDLNEDRLENLSARCQRCGNHHAVGDDCEEARQRYARERAKYEDQLDSWISPFKYPSPRIRVPEPLRVRDLPVHASFKYVPNPNLSNLRCDLRVAVPGPDDHTGPPSFADTWCGPIDLCGDYEVREVLLSRADPKDPKYASCARKMDKLAALNNLSNARTPARPVIMDASVPPRPKENSWQCQHWQCPERPPVKAATAPYCYTCGQEMKKV